MTETAVIRGKAFAKRFPAFESLFGTECKACFTVGQVSFYFPSTLIWGLRMPEPKGILGSFKIKGILSAGPEVSSYLATDPRGSRGNRWVLKSLELDGLERRPRNRLRRDLVELASLSHISLALPSVFAAEAGSGRISWARRFIDGVELPTVIKGCSPAEAVRWMVLTTEALELLHRFGFLHRSLKPTNFFVPRSVLSTREKGEARVVLCDPAWWPDSEDHRWQGNFLAPELKSGESATFASDLFSLGVVFHRLLTGKDAKPGQRVTLRPGSEGKAAFLTDLSRILSKLLSVDPRSRYQKAQTLIEDLRGLSELPSSGVTALPDYLFGRREELERITKALGDQHQALGFAICGEAGMGKSVLLRRINIEAELLGYRTVCFASNPESAAVPPSLESLFSQLIPQGPRGRALRSRLRGLLRVEGNGDGTSRSSLVQELLELFLASVALEPTLVLVDDLHQAGGRVVELFGAILAEISASEPSRSRGNGQSPPRVVVTFRSESPYRSLIQPILDVIEPVELSGERGALPKNHGKVELAPLPAETIAEWVDLVLPADAGARDQILYALQLRGRPFSIQEALRVGGARLGEVPALSGGLAEACRTYLTSLGALERAIVETLAILGRPASPNLLSSLVDRRPAELAPPVEGLLKAGTLHEEAGSFSLRHGSFRAWLVETLEAELAEPTRETSRASVIHRRLAQTLENRKGESTEEIAQHWLRSSSPRRGIPAARRAARSLVAQGEDQRALLFYGDLIRILPTDGGQEARSLLSEAAEAYSRVGEHRQSIGLLERLLGDAGENGNAASLHGRLGTFYHRSGDVAKAVEHLEKGLALLPESRGSSRFLDWLGIASELAEISCKKGDYSRAQSLCSGALKEIQSVRSGRGSREVRHAEMVLLETLAHVKLRRFEHDEARVIFERSLAISEEIEATVERSLILNNLAVLHNQQNRFQDAIECYQEAERLSTRRGGDLSLVNIHSNLAHLHAKCGQPEAADEALQRAVYHDARLGSKRTRFLRLHCSGLVDLCFGRLERAQSTLQEAASIAEELEDFFLAGFDLVYLGECHLFRGDFEAAESAFERALKAGAATAPPVAAMVAARKAALSALRGRVREAKAACELSEKPATIPFVHAWNSIFLGWAHRLLSQRQEAFKRLEEARAFFYRIGLPQGEIHSELELVALETDSGEFGNAEKRLRALRTRYACGRGALKNPLLSARLLAYHARLLIEQSRGDLDEAATSLIEAEAYLVGQRVRDLEVLLKELRHRLEAMRATDSATASAVAPRSSESSGTDARLPTPRAASGSQQARDLSTEKLVDGLQSMARELALQAEGASSPEQWTGIRKSLHDLGRRVEALGQAFRGQSSAPAADLTSILGQSPAIRAVLGQVQQLASLELPVLITGETGTGKDLVARALHGVGRRRSGPFVSLNCAALPEELLEAELFGYVKGAFSSADRDHSGLLVSAQGGTVFFDEVGEIPLTLQAKLLRVLDRGTVRPLGADSEVRVDVRYLFSSNRSLRSLVDEGKFRSDLFFRLGAFEVKLPALRDRREDLPGLVDHFRRKLGSTKPLFDESALKTLSAHAWPGNVRELENVIQRLVLTNAERVTSEEVRGLLGKAATEPMFPAKLLKSLPLDELHAPLERDYLRQLYRDRGGSLRAMAAALGITLKALYKRLHTLGVRPKDLGGA